MASDPFTTAVHADAGLGDLDDVAPPIRPSTTFERGGDYIYRRDGHETVRRLEAVVGALEGGDAVAYPSGMAAVAAVIRHIGPRRVLLPAELYHGVVSFVEAQAARGDFDVARSVPPQAGDLVWIETPSNPRGIVTDVVAAATEARDVGATSVVDATFATPVLQKTLDLGADFVVHSSTKFIGGHSDASGGLVVTKDAGVAATLRAVRSREGAVPGAFETWLTLRGVRTLPLRITRQSDTAMRIATHLQRRGLVVFYPGLETNPGHDTAAAQMTAFGGVLSLELPDRSTAEALIAALRLFRDATSLGGVESLVERRVQSDPASPPGLIRFSVGLEDADDLIGDLDAAMAAAIAGS